MRTVKVDVKIDNEGYACYLVEGRVYGAITGRHEPSFAEMFAKGIGSEFDREEIEELGIDSSEVIHSYEVIV